MPLVVAITVHASALGDGKMPLLFQIAVSLGIVLGSLTRLLKAIQPWLIERERTSRAIGVEGEITLRSTGVTIDADGTISTQGAAADGDPGAVAKAAVRAATRKRTNRR